MPNRRVELAPGYIAAAKALFPVGGWASGWPPSYELFQQRPERAAIFQFETDFDNLPCAVEGVGALRFVMTIDAPVFPPLVFFGSLGSDDIIHLQDVIWDPDYWEMINADPDS